MDMNEFKTVRFTQESLRPLVLWCLKKQRKEEGKIKLYERGLRRVFAGPVYNQ